MGLSQELQRPLLDPILCPSTILNLETQTSSRGRINLAHHLLPLLSLSHRHFYAKSTFLCHQASAHMGSLGQKNLPTFISSFYSAFEFCSGLISLKTPLWVSCPMFSEHPMLPGLQSLPIGHCVLLNVKYTEPHLSSTYYCSPLTQIEQGEAHWGGGGADYYFLKGKLFKDWH